MGGYGALGLALRNPELFCSAHSHSGAVDFAHNEARWSDPDRRDELERIVGATPRGSDYDLYTLAEKVDLAAMPALRIDCGIEDFLIEQNREFHRHLETCRVPHEYSEHPGAHNWEYWDRHIQSALHFHARHLDILSP